MKNLSVIIPFYNEKEFLEISVKRVTDLDIFDQIILTDDCSTDGSSEIALQLIKNNPCIEYIKEREIHGNVTLLIMQRI